jgi:hypothetical protein
MHKKVLQIHMPIFTLFIFLFLNLYLYQFIFGLLKVDKRILKAASIEHANNLDAAVEFILQEVIPSIPEPIMSSKNGGDNSNFYEAPPEGIFLIFM